MLDLSSIFDLDFDYSNPDGRAAEDLYDVIRSLSTTITDQSDEYIQKYISLETFDNSGEESTSAERKLNAATMIIRSYEDISFQNALDKCRDIHYQMSNSLIGFDLHGVRYVFGFNGRDLVFIPEQYNLGRDVLTINQHGSWSYPNAKGLDTDTGTIVNSYFSCCTEMKQTALSQNGTRPTLRRQFWICISDSLRNDSNGYYVPVNLFLYDVYNNKKSLFTVREEYVPTNDYGLALIAALRGMSQNLRNLLEVYLYSHNYLTFVDDLTSLTSTGHNCLAIAYNRYHYFLPSLTSHDFLLNSRAGREALRCERLPGDIVNWIKFNR